MKVRSTNPAGVPVRSRAENSFRESRRARGSLAVQHAYLLKEKDRDV